MTEPDDMRRGVTADEALVLPGYWRIHSRITARPIGRKGAYIDLKQWAGAIRHLDRASTGTARSTRFDQYLMAQKRRWRERRAEEIAVARLHVLANIPADQFGDDQ